MPEKVKANSEPAELKFIGAKLDITAAADGSAKPATFSMLAYSGGAMRVKGFSHPVVIDLKGMEGMDRPLPAFLDHNPAQIVGHITDTNVSGNQLTASGVISGAGDAAREVAQASKNGFPYQSSVGSRVLGKMEFVREGQTAQANGKTFDGPVLIARRSRLGEISFTAMGADENTSARVAATKKRRTNTMAESIETEDQTEGDVDPIAKERLRASAITKIAGKFKLDEKRRDTITAKAIDEGWDESRTELEFLRAQRPSGGPYINTGSRDGAPDENTVIEAAMCLNAGLTEKFIGEQYDERIVDAAVSKPYRGFGLHSLLRCTLRAAGRHVPERIDDDAIREAFEADRFLRASGVGYSTMSLSNVTANVQNKSALQAYNAVATTWKNFCAIGDQKDFKPGLRIRLLASGKFQKVGPAGELKNMSLQDQGFATNIHTEGAVIVTTRETIINDDMSMLTDQPKVIGRQGAIAVERAVFTLLLSNPSSFFGSGNGNLATGGGSALSTAALTAAEQLFLKQTDPNGDPTLIMPTILLVPPELAVTASVLTRSAEVRDTTASTKYATLNPHAGRFTPAASPWLSLATLTGYSATAWYLFADPNDVAAMEVTFMGGAQSPTISNGEPNFNTLGIATRGWFDFGANLLDPRAAVRSDGA